MASFKSIATTRIPSHALPLNTAMEDRQVFWYDIGSCDDYQLGSRVVFADCKQKVEVVSDEELVCFV